MRALASKTLGAHDCFRSWEVKDAVVGDASPVYLEMVALKRCRSRTRTSTALREPWSEGRRILRRASSEPRYVLPPEVFFLLLDWRTNS